MQTGFKKLHPQFCGAKGTAHYVK